MIDFKESNGAITCPPYNEDENDYPVPGFTNTIDDDKEDNIEDDAHDVHAAPVKNTNKRSEIKRQLYIVIMLVCTSSILIAGILQTNHGFDPITIMGMDKGDNSHNHVKETTFSNHAEEGKSNDDSIIAQQIDIDQENQQVKKEEQEQTKRIDLMTEFGLPFTYEEVVNAALKDTHLFSEMLDAMPKLVTMVGSDGWSLLHKVAQGGKTTSVYCILNRVNDVDFVNRKTSNKGRYILAA